jgi:hypothetical protein
MWSLHRPSKLCFFFFILRLTFVVVEARRPERRREWYVNFQMGSTSELTSAESHPHIFQPVSWLLSRAKVPNSCMSRNFKSRNDGNRYTMNFLASPTIVTAMAFSGKLSFNPATDSVTLPNGEPFKFSPPSGQDLPSKGFALGNKDYYPPPVPEPQPEIEVIIKNDSQRLELLEPFLGHFGPQNPRGLELPSLKVLMRVKGKCTTDHISAAVSFQCNLTTSPAAMDCCR